MTRKKKKTPKKKPARRKAPARKPRKKAPARRALSLKKKLTSKVPTRRALPQCQTCANAKWAAAVKEFIKLRDAGELDPAWSLAKFHSQVMVPDYGYTLRPSALSQHVRNCLGGNQP